MSFDTPKANAAFAQKNRFPFPLLTDQDKTLAIAFGAAKDASAKYPRRVSVLIGKKGKVLRIYRKVDPRTHAAQVLRDLARSSQ